MSLGPLSVKFDNFFNRKQLRGKIIGIVTSTCVKIFHVPYLWNTVFEHWSSVLVILSFTLSRREFMLGVDGA